MGENEKNIFPKVNKVLNNRNIVEIATRRQYQYPILERYLKRKIQGWSIGLFLNSINTKKIVLYAVTEFTEFAMLDLQNFNGDIEVLCICDRAAQSYAKGFCGASVVGVDQMMKMYENKEFEKVLVCTCSHANSVFSDLLSRGVNLDDIISISSAIYY
ncbi:MAG: hypothetical protein IJZ76_00480 [Lachnospiraceae bacterium]|nr:hypothetical protein [Lachnospiraceae bacterium]